METFNNQFGLKIKWLRESKNLLQRQIAAELEIDTPMLSKIERGERKAKKSQVLQLAKLYSFNPNKLITLWLADQVHDVLQGEELADEVLKNVADNIHAMRN